MSAPHISPFTSDRLAFGTLTGAEKERVEAHLTTCVECLEAAQTAAESRAHFTRFVAPRGLRGSRGLRRWWPAWIATPTLALAGLMVMLMLRPQPRTEDGELGIKGGPLFSTFVRHAGKVAPLGNHATLHAGDELRFVAVSSDLPYLLVCSLDGAGHPSVYYPFGGAASGHIATQTRVELPGSVILDESPGPERLFALFSKAPIPAADATRALTTIVESRQTIRTTNKLAVPADVQVSVLFEKSE